MNINKKNIPDFESGILMEILEAKIILISNDKE